MKWVRVVLSFLITGVIFWGLDNTHGQTPPLGKLLNPFAGFWQNGTRQDALPKELTLEGLKDEVEVVWDARRVPHIFAANEHDLYFAQGYISAFLRLWQMEFQAFGAAGRVSEIIGPAGLEHDRFQRRFGMLWAAEENLELQESTPGSREIIHAYADGVNAYIQNLKTKDRPLEYKLLDYAPEPWSALKSNLLLKHMALMLSSINRDAVMTALRDGLGESAVKRLFPDPSPFETPIIPESTVWDFTPVPLPSPPAIEVNKEQARQGAAAERENSDSAPFFAPPPLPGIGSNSWAVSGKLTRSGYPLLCNDPHLELKLPSIWYELQLCAPGINARGVAFAGNPCVILGHNESAAWGFTTALTDVLDWYAVRFKDDRREEYLYDGEWKETSVREEQIKVRGEKTVIERVIYTHHGPLVRLGEEPPFSMTDVPADAALRWLGHDPSNEVMTFYLLNKTAGYDDFLEARAFFECPSHNIVYADKAGDIAIWHQGKFPLRWKGQGRYVLDASESSHEWQGWVPNEHNPHTKNPERGFVSSANQKPTGDTYPYYLGRAITIVERGVRINELLPGMINITPGDMKRMQTDTLNVRARSILPALLAILEEEEMTAAEKRCFEELQGWDFEQRADFVAPSIFDRFWTEINERSWNDEKPESMEEMLIPDSSVTIDIVLNEPESEFFDDKTTEEVETLPDIVLGAFRAAVEGLEERWGPMGNAWVWGNTKGTDINHLALVPGFGRVNIGTDGDGYIINAITRNTGPSWRMVVELGPEVRAWGIYPGGQSGNPGSEFYENFIDDWVAGRTYELLFLESADEEHPEIVGKTMMRRGMK